MPMNSYDVAAVRAAFPALKAGTAHFDGPGGTQVPEPVARAVAETLTSPMANRGRITHCLLYTSPSPRDGLLSRMPSSA